MIWLILACVLVPFVLSMLAALFVRRWALRLDFVDRPGGHKAHHRPVPLGGGVAVVLAVVVSVLGGTLGAVSVSEETWRRVVPDVLSPHVQGIRAQTPLALAVLGGAVVLHVLGLLDDRRALGAGAKFLVQALVALALTAGLGIRSLELLGPIPATVLSTLWIILITNAFNFLDNMDGLCAGVACIAAAILAGTSLHAGQVFVPVLALILVGALAGFLPLNLAPASIFMGDAGSLPIGYLLAVLTILTTFYDPAAGTTPFGILVPFVVLAVPLYDSFSVMVIRYLAGDSVFRGDRRHFSHRLTQRGLSPRMAVLTVYLATTATGLAAVLLPTADWPVAAIVLAQTLCLVGLIALLEFGRRDRQDS